jgi:hypothetical protein
MVNSNRPGGRAYLHLMDGTEYSARVLAERPPNGRQFCRR